MGSIIAIKTLTMYCNFIALNVWYYTGDIYVNALCKCVVE